eukprot:2541069-Alexandrium_andersonii.AAC.1
MACAPVPAEPRSLSTASQLGWVPAGRRARRGRAECRMCRSLAMSCDCRIVAGQWMARAVQARL